MPAPLFKRFAPQSPAPAKQSSPPSSSPISAQAHAGSTADAVAPKKEKKSKRTSKAAVANAEQIGPQEDVVMEDAPAPKASKESKKRKSEVVQEEDARDEEVSKKHKAVFSKFEKASKLSEARKDQGEADVEQQPEEELHGKLLVLSGLRAR